VVIRFHPLQHGGGPFEPHAGVDVLAGQGPQVVRRVAHLAGQGPQVVRRVAHTMELGKDQVPDLHFAEIAVVVDLAAGAADAVRALAGGVGGPEVLVLAQPLELLRQQLDIVEPDLGRLVIVEVDRRGELLRVDAQPFLVRAELPRPKDRLAFEIVAEAEIAQHLEERVVVGRAAHVVDIAGPQALLAGRRPGELQLAAAEEMVLELVHPGGGEQHRRVPAGHEHVAGAADAALGLEEFQVLFAQLVAFHDGPLQAREDGSGSNPL